MGANPQARASSPPSGENWRKASATHPSLLVITVVTDVWAGAPSAQAARNVLRSFMRDFHFVPASDNCALLHEEKQAISSHSASQLEPSTACCWPAPEAEPCAPRRSTSSIYVVFLGTDYCQ